MIASAAGLNTLAERERNMYLLRTAATAVMATMYHGSCARKTIAVMRAVSTAPLGNSQTFFIALRISVSTKAAAMVALTSPLAAPIPWGGAAKTTKITRIMVSRPLGVLKKFLALRRMTQTSRFIALQFWSHNQPVHAMAIQKLDAGFRTKHKCGRCESIGQHRSGRDHRHAG